MDTGWMFVVMIGASCWTVGWIVGWIVGRRFGVQWENHAISLCLNSADVVEQVAVDLEGDGERAWADRLRTVCGALRSVGF